jgi:hypothetical protein
VKSNIVDSDDAAGGAGGHALQRQTEEAFSSSSFYARLV